MTRAIFGAIAMIAVIGLGAPRANAQASLNQSQGALYLACVATATFGTLPTNVTPNMLAASVLTNQEAVSQMQSITSLQGMGLIDLGKLVSTTVKTYATKQLGCTKKCTKAALTLFSTQSQSSCLTIASGFAP